MAASATTRTQRSIGAELERLRLEDRARRVGFALAALRRLSDARAAEGAIPEPLRQAIAGFSADLLEVDQRLAELEVGSGGMRAVEGVSYA